MRAIDADVLLYNLEGTMAVSPTGYIHGDTIVDMIGDAPTIEPEPHWIPCSKALPKTNGVYVVTRNISDGFECRNITDACYFDGTNTWHDDTRVNHSREYLTDVIAWMPLPEPYREGEGWVASS